MPLFIKNEDVNELAEKFQKIGGFSSKTEAVETALRDQIALVSNKVPLLDRLEPILQQVDSMGQEDPDFDMKKFTDEMWEKH